MELIWYILKEVSQIIRFIFSFEIELNEKETTIFPINQ